MDLGRDILDAMNLGRDESRPYKLIVNQNFGNIFTFFQKNLICLFK